MSKSRNSKYYDDEYYDSNSRKKSNYKFEVKRQKKKQKDFYKNSQLTESSWLTTGEDD